MIGYKLTLDECHGWLFMGTSPTEVAEVLKNELAANEGLSVEEISAMRIEPIEISQWEIDSMPEHEGW